MGTSLGAPVRDEPRQGSLRTLGAEMEIGQSGSSALDAPQESVVRRERQPTLGVVAAAFAAFGWGIAAIFIKLSHVAPLALTEYRLVIAAVYLAAMVVVARRRLRIADLGLVAAGGILLCVDMGCFFAAVEQTRVADASVIGALQPALVLLVAGPLFSERVELADVMWTALAIVAVSAVVVGGGVPRGTSLSGDLLAVASVIAWSGYFIVSKKARGTIGPIEYTFGVTVVAAVVLLPVLFLSGESAAVPHPGDWLWILLLALVPGTGHLLINWAHRSVDVSVSSVIGASNPIFAAGGAWIVLGQGLGAIQIASGIVAIAAIAVVAARKRVPASPPLDLQPSDD